MTRRCEYPVKRSDAPGMYRYPTCRLTYVVVLNDERLCKTHAGSRLIGETKK